MYVEIMGSAFSHCQQMRVNFRRTTVQRDAMFEVLLPVVCIRPATWLHSVHGIAVPIFRSPQCSWWGLVLTETHPAQWVTLYNIWASLASFPGLPRFSSLVCVQYNTRKRKSTKKRAKSCELGPTCIGFYLSERLVPSSLRQYRVHIAST